MKIISHFLGLFAFLIWSQGLYAESISGKLRLDHQNIYVSPDQPYSGRFDLRHKLPLGDDFVLSRVTVSFKFIDDKEWQESEGQGSLMATGEVNRHGGDMLTSQKGSGQTDIYYESLQVIEKTNEEEVAEVTIGRNTLYSATIHRRDVMRESQGQKAIFLGLFEDKGDNNNLRHHYRITDMVVESRLDGYDGPFEIRDKALDLTTQQDLANTGFLDFKLSSKGDYIFVGASLTYEGYTRGIVKTAQNDNLLPPVALWIGGISFPLAGLFWWRRGQNNGQRVRKAGRPSPKNSRKLKAEAGLSEELTS